MGEGENDIEPRTRNILVALMGGYAQTAYVVSRMLEKESLTDQERDQLRATMSRGVLATADVIDEALPGRGEDILRIWEEHRKDT